MSVERMTVSLEGVLAAAVRSRGLRNGPLDLRLGLLGAAACLAGGAIGWIGEGWPDWLAAICVFLAVSLVWAPRGWTLWTRNRAAWTPVA